MARTSRERIMTDLLSLETVLTTLRRLLIRLLSLARPITPCKITATIEVLRMHGAKE